MDSRDDNISYVDVTELFVTGDTPAGGSEVTSTIGKIDSPIKDLKAVVLSLDWEITDKTMQNFAEEIDRLEEMWAADKILIAFLQILRALGQYIAKKKARAHPDSVKLLYSVYNNLEKVILTEDMPRPQKKEIVAHELRKYMKLKKQFDITASSAVKPEKVEKSEIVIRDQEVAAPEVEMEPAVQPLPDQVLEPGTAVDEEPVVEAVPAVEGDEMPAALAVEEMEEQMQTEVVGLDISPAGEASGPMEEMYETQPFSPADELLAKMHLGLLDKKGGEAEPSSQAKEIIPELSKEESFPEIENRLDEFFDKEPAEAEYTEAGDEAASLEMEAPAVERVEEEVAPLEEDIPAEESVEEGVVPLAVVFEEAVEAADVTHDVDSRLDDLFGEGDELPVPPEDETLEPEIEEEPVLHEEPVEEVGQEAAAPPPLEVPAVELQVEDLLVDEVKVPASEAGKEVTPEDEAALKLELMEEEEPPAVAVAEEEVSEEEAVIPFEFEDEYLDEEREGKGEEDVVVDSAEEFTVPTAALMESLDKLVSSSINVDADQQSIEDFSQVIRNAKEAWQDEPELTMFLNIMDSLGKNVTLPVESAALNSVTMLRSVFSSMEVALSSHDKTRADTREILFREMNKYIQHQEQLILSAISTPGAGVDQVLEKESVVPPPVPEYEPDEQTQASETKESSHEEEIEEENGAILLPKSEKARPGFLERLKKLFK
ncbi:MAG: hypothetical protein U9O82_01620 [Thermodesulfobacteriota bacterium]|nr:hypothetical protein [Thermodesulfobacteriota bacterium]